MKKSSMYFWKWFAVAVVLVLLGLWWWTSQPTYTPYTQIPATQPNETNKVAVVAKPSQTVASIIASLSGSTQFAALFVSVGGNSLVAGKGPFTVFVSTDAGYALLPAGTISKMTAAQKLRLVKYSIVSGRALDISATNSGQLQALSKDTLNFQVQSSGLVQVNSSFALQEYKASNGIVYVINQPLLPPTLNNY